MILRPEPGASATFVKAVEYGLDAVKLPLFEIERLTWTPPSVMSEFDALLLTSANAIREAGEGLEPLRSLPVHVVGPATARAAAEAGLTVVTIGSSDLGALLRSLPSHLRLLHLAGEDRVAGEPPRQSITVVPVYRARMIEGIDSAPIAGSVVLVHSPRAGARIAEIVEDRASVSIAAISKAAAEACGAEWRDLDFAAQPTDRALLALAARLCEKSGE